VLNRSVAVLQIVPRTPGSREGVGDYALTLAAGLKSCYDRETTFLAATTSAMSVAGFPVFQLNAISEGQCHELNCENIVLHYVNYGYQNRGIPFGLLKSLRRLRGFCDGRFVTVFHELYASAPPWRSAFWLQPLQKLLAGKVARMSDACVVSSEVMRDALQRLSVTSTISVHPVSSSVGEPALSTEQLSGRDPHRWVMFGGTHLVERSLNSFFTRADAIPDSFLPNELFVLGGNDNPVVRERLKKVTRIKCEYFPVIAATAASDILSSCAFGWIDYFRQPDTPTAAILKSGSYTALCAHGVVPVFPHAGSTIAMQSDSLPGPFFVNRTQTKLPSEATRSRIACEIYEWYWRHASSENFVRGIAASLAMRSSAASR
jgi:hypothetical protein